MNPFDLLKNINMDDLKKKSEETMGKLKEMTATGESGGGFVKVTLNGEFQIVSIDYEDNDFIKEDINAFKDLIIAAHNIAAKNMRDEIQKNLSQNIIPGLF